MAHQFFKSDGFFDDFGLSQDEIRHIALDDHRFDFGQTLVVTVVPANHVIRTLVAGGQLFDVCLDLFRLGMQGVAKGPAQPRFKVRGSGAEARRREPFF